MYLTKRTLVPWAALAAVTAALATVSTLGAVTSQAATNCSNGYVALTFDDGPNASTTNLLLSTLRSAGVRATLFNIGQNAAANPSLVGAEQAAGMWIGNHSYTHSHMTSMSQSTMQSELSRTQQAITSAGGAAPKIFRPPYGEHNSTLDAVATGLGLRTVTWDVDSQDWNGASTSAIVAAAGQLQNGGVILMHDNYATTRAAIPTIVSNLTARGLCAGMISSSTGRAVAPDGTTPPVTTPPVTTPPVTTPPSGTGGCTASYAVTSSWSGGFVSSVTVTATTGAISGWRVTLNLPAGATIASLWNGTSSGTSGTVQVSNASYNGRLAAGTSTTFGFQGNGNGTGATVSCTAS